MIEKTKVYGHDGYLIHTEKPRIENESLFGVFIYHDVGATEKYGAWNKLTILNAIYNQRKSEWQFNMARMKYGQYKRMESIGIRPEFWSEFLEVVNTIIPELLGQPIPTNKELKKIGVETIRKDKISAEEAEIKKLEEELSK